MYSTQYLSVTFLHVLFDILFYHTYTEDAVNLLQSLYQILCCRIFNIQHGICHFTAGFVGHIGDIDVLLTDHCGKLIQHLGNISHLRRLSS